LITAADDVKSASAENTPSSCSNMAVVYVCKVIDSVNSGLVEYCQMSQIEPLSVHCPLTPISHSISSLNGGISVKWNLAQIFIMWVGIA